MTQPVSDGASSEHFIDVTNDQIAIKQNKQAELIA